MGIFDAIKQVGSFFTNGGATVTLRPVNQVSDGHQPVQLLITCAVEDKALDVKKIYLQVRASEKVTVRNVERARKMGDRVDTRREDVSESTQTYSTEIQLSGPQQLNANESYEWPAEFVVPAHINGTYRGPNASHEWSVYVGLDVAGNDPDSGWVQVEIKK